MTYQEALYQITNWALDDEDSPKELREAARVFRVACEKQVPVKPKVKLYDDVDERTNRPYTWLFYTCPVCEEHIGVRGNHYCSHCGQALDWGNKDDV